MIVCLESAIKNFLVKSREFVNFCHKTTSGPNGYYRFHFKNYTALRGALRWPAFDQRKYSVELEDFITGFLLKLKKETLVLKFEDDSMTLARMDEKGIRNIKIVKPIPNEVIKALDSYTTFNFDYNDTEKLGCFYAGLEKILNMASDWMEKTQKGLTKHFQDIINQPSYAKEQLESLVMLSALSKIT